MIDDTFFFSLQSSVLLVMSWLLCPFVTCVFFFWGAFICLVLLVDGFCPYHFNIQGFYFHILEGTSSVFIYVFNLYFFYGIFLMWVNNIRKFYSHCPYWMAAKNDRSQASLGGANGLSVGYCYCPSKFKNKKN